VIDGLDMERVGAMVRGALEEDAAAHDATIGFAGVAAGPLRARVLVSQSLTVAGMAVAREVFRQRDASVVFAATVADGERVDDGASLLEVTGPARSILSAERTALNFLQRMCGIATLTSRYVAAVAGTGVTVLDTRKTVPLWRELDKYAVRCGGASNHRRDLKDMILIKENHVRAAGGVDAVLVRIAASSSDGFVELEVDSMAMLDRVLASPGAERIDRVMLDNFAPAPVRDAVGRIRAWREALPARRLQIEVSGGIELSTIRDYAIDGVDFISVGALTHSAPAASMSLDVTA
jgi:nicotinate-nucleotide pyrophosphorylase (carboxylating)